MNYGDPTRRYSRETPDGRFKAWAGGNRYWTLSPSHNPSQIGTLCQSHEEARAGVDAYMKLMLSDERTLTGIQHAMEMTIKQVTGAAIEVLCINDSRFGVYAANTADLALARGVVDTMPDVTFTTEIVFANGECVAFYDMGAQ